MFLSLDGIELNNDFLTHKDNCDIMGVPKLLLYLLSLLPSVMMKSLHPLLRPNDDLCTSITTIISVICLLFKTDLLNTQESDTYTKTYSRV